LQDTDTLSISMRPCLLPFVSMPGGMQHVTGPLTALAMAGVRTVVQPNCIIVFAHTGMVAVKAAQTGQYQAAASPHPSFLDPDNMKKVCGLSSRAATSPRDGHFAA
jgi:hypothetical protein